MKKSMFAGLIVLGMALFVSTGVTGGSKKFKGQLPAGWKKLDLSKVQVNKIYAVQKQHREKIRALEEQIVDLRVQEKTEMVKVLTPEQKDRLRKILLGEEKKTPTKPKDKDR